MLISFTGAQSTGKTTLLNECKRIYEDHYTFVDEITRRIGQEGHPINEQGTDAVQLRILNSHIDNAKLNNAFLDRCIVDGYIYTKYLVQQGTVSKPILDYAYYLHSQLIGKYDKIFYTSPKDVPLANDGVRSVNVDFRNSIIELYDQYMSFHDTSKFVILEGSVLDRLKTITSIVPLDN